MAAGAIDDDVLAVGRDVAARFPSAARRPLKALDDKAMDLASQDEQLRAALFRFVDVVPACRSLDDLARHLTGFLDEVPDRPPPLEVAMRMSGTKAGRAALGAAALPRANLSVKVSALTPLLRPDAPEIGQRDAAPRLRELLRRAAQRGAHLHIDMESFDSHEAVTDLVLELLSEDEFRDSPSAGLVLPAYLRDSPAL